MDQPLYRLQPDCVAQSLRWSAKGSCLVSRPRLKFGIEEHSQSRANPSKWDRAAHANSPRPERNSRKFYCEQHGRRHSSRADQFRERFQEAVHEPDPEAAARAIRGESGGH